MTETLPPLVDTAWLAARLGEAGLVVADVRGPNAHARGHIPGSIPLVLGSPSPSTDREVLEELASEVGLRLRRHGVTGEEQLVLYDGGDCVSASASAQLAELAGHPDVAVVAGGLAAWEGELDTGPIELERTRAELTPNFEAFPTLDDVRSRLGDPSVTLLDVRRVEEYTGRSGYPCDRRQGHIPGARNLDVALLFDGPGRPKSPGAIRDLSGLPEGGDVIAYCHSGSRSGLAALALRSAGYAARNYVGSWHEWSRHAELPVER